MRRLRRRLTSAPWEPPHRNGDEGASIRRDIPVLTGATGLCPLYTVLGISTCPRKP
ncbi:MAG: DUF2892 domain-containing protein [Holophagaceae bacterium]|nr:DUF2892 domain-containing protein [Holophagaceae bacterium]